MEFHRARTVRMAGASAPPMPAALANGATNQAGRSSATGGDLGLAARVVGHFARSFGYARQRPPGGSD